MKKLLVSILVLVLAHSGSAFANLTTYTDTQELYTVIDASNNTFLWEHHNPAETPAGPMTPEEYGQAVLDGKVTSATLTIALDSLEPGDTVDAWIRDVDNVWHNLGPLQTMTSSDGLSYIEGQDAYEGHHSSVTYEIEPGWLNGLPVGTGLSVITQGISSFEIETSALGVTVSTTPAPGAILLGGIGICLVGWLRRRGRI